MIETGKNQSESAAKAGMTEKTARKYINAKAPPEDLKKPHGWVTRNDPFEPIWNEIKDFLENDQMLEAKSMLGYLQNKHPGCFPDSQLRTLQRKFKKWRALSGVPKEVYFEQVHYPGVLAQSDFTEMNSLGITIRKEIFRHILYHFILTYSNWETGSVCFSESFQSLSDGLQNALWELNGVMEKHQTDRLSAAVNKECNPNIFTDKYTALLEHYGIEGKRINPAEPNENGDIEQRNYRFKKAVRQALILRGSSDFDSEEDYKTFLKDMFRRQNMPRQKKFAEEVAKLRPLPRRRLDVCLESQVRVSKGSTIVIERNVYSVDSRLIGEWVGTKLSADRLEIFYAGKKVAEMPRLKGREKHNIQYRHIIDWLVRKPGAFENYKFRDDMYPTSRFRMYYDRLRREDPLFASRRYLEALHLAVREGEQKVDQLLGEMLSHRSGEKLEGVKKAFDLHFKEKHVRDVHVESVNLEDYDLLISGSAGSDEVRI